MHGSRPPRTRVVIVTLDNHLAGAVERASAVLAHEGIDTGFHAASDWDRDEKALARAIDDVSRADIVIATMLFLDDHIRAIRPALEARRDGCDAMLGLMSGGEIVRLTKMGGYRMDAPAKGPLALLKRLRGSSKPGASSGAGQMKMLRRLPKLLRFIPGTAQDVRAYFLTLQYWLAGSDANVVNMVRALALRYAKATRPDAPKADAPVEYPELGVYHPRLAGRISESADALARLKGQPPKTVRPEPGEGLSFLGAIAQKKSRASTSSARTEIGKAGVQGTVGLLMLRSYLLANDTGHYDGVIAALEARGLAVIPAFASGLDARPAIDAFFLKDGRPTVDAVVSLTGFSLVGGPAYNDAQAAEAMLARLDVPYVAAHPLEFQTLEAWGAGTQGLLPIEATMMVAIPELDGAIVPHVFGGRSDGAGAACTGCARGCTFPTGGLVREMRACPERAEALAAKVARLYELESTLIPEGLHVFGRGMGSDAATRVREALGEPALDLESSNELDALMRALDASFIAPAPGGDLIRNPAILPTGRNIHGFDPFRIPSRFAMAEGAAQADALIARHMANGAPFPASLALVLWGTDNLKSEGSQLAQALALIGARPRFDGYGRLAGAELIPLAELGRPRVDVIVTLSGIFRDLLPLQTRMIAEAAYLAASADEPLELNHVRAGIAALALLHGFAWASARTTIYTLTNRRVVIRAGVALPTCINVPLSLIEAADLRAYDDGTGDIPMRIRRGEEMGYAQLWPHARPWHVNRAQPMLRAIPEAARVAALLARASGARMAEVAREPALALAAAA